MRRRTRWQRLPRARTPFDLPLALAGVTFAGLLALCPACHEGNYRLTGETNLYQTDEYVGVAPIVGYGQTYLPHDRLVAGDATIPRLERTRTAIVDQITPGYYRALPDDQSPYQRICIVLNRCFLKYLNEIGKPEVLAYVEVEDGVGSKPIKNVFFRDDYQPAGALLNFQDAIIYGPAEFSGNPITIRFYVCELDKEDNQIASAVVETVAGTAKTFGGPYGLVADLVGEIVKTIIETNVDDREFYHQVTLYPSAPTGEDPPRNATALRTGTYVIVKKEVRRIGADLESVVDFEFERKVDLGLGEWPNIVARSGRLFHHDRLFDFYRELDRTTGWTVSRKLQGYASARKSAVKQGKQPPNVGDMFASIDRVIARKAEAAQAKVRKSAAPSSRQKRVKALAATIKQDAAWNKQLEEWLTLQAPQALAKIDAWIDEQLDKDTPSLLQDLPLPVSDDQLAEFEQIKKTQPDPKKFSDAKFARLNKLHKFVQKRREARKTQLLREIERQGWEDYVDYRSKSYLTFSVINTLEAADPQLLNEQYTSSAELIEKTLNTRVDTDTLARRIVGLQQKATDAIVAAITARKLKGADTKNRPEIKKALEKIYPNNKDAIASAYKQIVAEQELSRLRDPGSASMRDKVSKLIGRLEQWRPLTPEMRAELKAELEKHPVLWEKVKPFFDGADLADKIAKVVQPDGVPTSQAVEAEEAVKERALQLLREYAENFDKFRALSKQERDQLAEQIKETVPDLWVEFEPLFKGAELINALSAARETLKPAAGNAPERPEAPTSSPTTAPSGASGPGDG